MSRQTAGTQAGATAWTRNDTVALLLVCAAALAARIVYLLCLKASIFFDHLVINAAQYEGWARHGYPSNEPYFQSPLYVTWLRAIFVLSSEHSQLLIVRLWQMFLGTASTAMAFCAARWLAGRTAAIVAGFLAGLASMIIFFDLEILPTALATALLAATITGHVAGSALPSVARSRFLWPGTALLLGLAAITRPNLLLLLPFLVVHRCWLTDSGPWQARVRPAALYMMVALLPVLLVTARNTSSGQGFVLLTTSVGDNLLLAHNPAADGFNPFPPAAVTDRLQAYDALGMNMVQRSAAARDEALQWMRQNPGATARLWWRKLAAFYNRADIPNNRSIQEQLRRCSVLRLPPVGWIGMGLLLPLALVGIVGLRRGDMRFLFVSVLVVVPLSLMPFLVCARFRTPLIPVLAILAGVGVAAAARAARRRPFENRPMLLMCGALAVGAAIAWPDWYGVQSLEFPRLATNRARLYRSVAEEQRAAGHEAAAQTWMSEVRRTLQAAIARLPHDATAHLWLADMNLEARQLDEARSGYETALSLDANLAAAHVGLARIAVRQRQIDAAEQHYRKALATQNRDTGLAVEFAEVLFRDGQHQEALAVVRRQLERRDLSPQERQGLQQLARRLGGR